MKLSIYGHSDDCLEIEGDARREFCGASERPFILLFDDGTEVRADYCLDGPHAGMWKILTTKAGPGVFSVYSQTAKSRKRGEYTDRLEIDGPFTTFRCFQELGV